MAYARKGERDSAIYLWSDGDFWFCDGCLLNTPNDVTISIAQTPDNFGILGHHLLEHVAKGQHVPDEVFDRLRAEMEGEVYITDVMRGLPAEVIVASARVDVQAGATHDCGEWLDPCGRCALCDRVIDVVYWRAWLIASAGECECRTTGCGHTGRQHNGPNGECEVCHQACWS